MSELRIAVGEPIDPEDVEPVCPRDFAGLCVSRTEVERLRELLRDIAVARRGDCPDVDREHEELPAEIRSDHAYARQQAEEIEALRGNLDVRDGELAHANAQRDQARAEVERLRGDVRSLRVGLAASAEEETRLHGLIADALRSLAELCRHLPETCHYHGAALDRPGPFGPACCDTGRPALARRNAELLADRVGRQAGLS